ncbi:hypothetical protein [Robertmurraya siralis]|uniref:hypothetical protein n=1 Tax=Robertmurraya siralis TaxID=77777 RepID=UPI0010F867A8|nr:hypothetical protein [Robertmurraya siralis]
MLRSVIEAPKTVEVYKISDKKLKRGTLVSKSNGVAVAANGNAVDVFILDADNQPMGHLSDVEISAYELDDVNANERGILTTYAVGAQFAVDQVEGEFTDGDYAVAVDGKFAPAQAGNVSKFKFVGNYQDGNVTLKQFRVVDPVTVE